MFNLLFAEEVVTKVESDFWQELIAKIPVTTIMWICATFFLLKALSDFFAFVASKTENKTDDKIMLYVGKVFGFLGKIIDTVTANSRG